MKENKIYIIAEMACSHDGDVKLAEMIIDGAGKAGADAIQLQIWSLVHVMAPSHPKYELCQRLELSRDQWKGLVAYSRKHYPSMDILAFVYEHKSIDFIDALGVDGYKLNSSDLSNPLVLDAVAATGKKINLSIGASTLEEIRSAVTRIRKRSQADITLMYGYQNFPTSISDINLNYTLKIKEEFGLPVGYQDHCDADSRSAFWIPAFAAGMGINVIEKHITHDRSLKGVDHESALNPDEFAEFVSMIRELESAKGQGDKKDFSEDELKYRQFQKKSIVAIRDIEAGERFEEKDINFLRNDKLGIAPDQAAKVIGRRAKSRIKAFQSITEEDLS